MPSVAIFDLDYTLLRGSSGLMYVREAIKSGRLPLWMAGYVGLLYRLKILNFGQAHARLITRVARHGPDEAAPFFAEWVPRRLFPRLSPVGLERLRAHRQAGLRVVIVSASIEEIVRPVAQHLNLGNDYLCTRLEVKDHHYTGQLDGPACYGEGKVEWVRRWLVEQNLPFPEAIDYVYTDSSSDLPLLKLARHPVAVNPSPRLEKVARARGWPVEKF